MAWLWWLLAPVLSTVAGASVLWWLGRREAAAARPRDAMGEHRALLAALAPAMHPGPAPVTMLVCPEPATGHDRPEAGDSTPDGGAAAADQVA